MAEKEKFTLPTKSVDNHVDNLWQPPLTLSSKRVFLTLPKLYASL
jgi:hypothetical protein